MNRYSYNTGETHKINFNESHLVKCLYGFVVCEWNEIDCLLDRYHKGSVINLSVLHPTDSERLWMHRNYYKHENASRCICLNAQNSVSFFFLLLLNSHLLMWKFKKTIKTQIGKYIIAFWLNVYYTSFSLVSSSIREKKNHWDQCKLNWPSMQ